MINPNQRHSARAVIHELPKGLYQTYKVRLVSNGAIVEGYDLPARFTVGDTVCIQASYSIVGERYIIRSIRKAPTKRVHLKLVVAS